jgi:hypothetical protein
MPLEAVFYRGKIIPQGDSEKVSGQGGDGTGGSIIPGDSGFLGKGRKNGQEKKTYRDRKVSHTPFIGFFSAAYEREACQAAILLLRNSTTKSTKRHEKGKVKPLFSIR